MHSVCKLLLPVLLFFLYNSLEQPNLFAQAPAYVDVAYDDDHPSQCVDVYLTESEETTPAMVVKMSSSTATASGRAGKETMGRIETYKRTLLDTIFYPKRNIVVAKKKKRQSHIYLQNSHVL